MSPCFIRKLENGSLHPVDYTAESLADAAMYEPANGVYTVTNTTNRFQTLKLNAHLDRLEDSARRAGIALRLDRQMLRSKLRQMIDTAGFGDVRFRVTVPRQADHLILSLEPFTPLSDSFIQTGVRVQTVPASARQDATIKSTAWMTQRKAIQASLRDGFYDAILLDADGHMMEGLGANFYTILDGTLHTPDHGVLAGIAQQIVLEVAPAILPVSRDSVHVDLVPQVQEAFITSSSRGIVPVIQIDDHRLGDGTPGAKTLTLLDVYRAWVNDHLEDL